MRVLIVRLSSMGDVVHTLPALTDAGNAIPGLSFDWAVDESFAQIPAWHKRVERVIPTALRRWGGNLAATAFRQFRKDLRRERYDLIVDLQGEFKSALISRMAAGLRCGYDAASIHEKGAQLVYRRKFRVPKGQHSSDRMRQLLAQTLGYSYKPAKADYGIDRSRLKPSPLNFPGPYVVFVHSTSWESKNWPERYWQELKSKAVAAGFHVVLPWGSEAERERSITIAAEDDRVTVLPSLSIAEKASIIGQAVATVGLDTGLSHIAAALGTPSVTLYGATGADLCGAIGEHQVHIESDFECVKCHTEKCFYSQPAEFKPACFVSLTPELVWTGLQTLINERREVYQLA